MTPVARTPLLGPLRARREEGWGTRNGYGCRRRARDDTLVYARAAGPPCVVCTSNAVRSFLWCLFLPLLEESCVRVCVMVWLVGWMRFGWQILWREFRRKDNMVDGWTYVYFFDGDVWSRIWVVLKLVEYWDRDVFGNFRWGIMMCIIIL